MSDPLAELESEHRVIEKVLTALEGGRADDADLAFFREAVRFIREFADGAHHRKEEEHLFPAMHAKGFPQEFGPVAVMLHEHQLGRAHVEAMVGHIASGDLDALRLEGRAYAALLREHIAKEDTVLFPMARQALTPEDIATIRTGFDAVGSDRATYEPIADGLLARIQSAP